MNLKDMLGQFAGNLPGQALQISWLKIDANGRDRRQIGDRLSPWTALLQRVAQRQPSWHSSQSSRMPVRARPHHHIVAGLAVP